MGENRLRARIMRKNSRRGVTPVVATILLISSTLVLALAVGAYTFGLFGSNVKTILLENASLYSGAEVATLGNPSQTSSYISFNLNNPGASSKISSFVLTGSAITAVGTWEIVNGSFAGFVQGIPSQFNLVYAGTVTPFTYYPFGVAQSVISGQLYSYTIDFTNGQSITGTLIAQ